MRRFSLAPANNFIPQTPIKNKKGTSNYNEGERNIRDKDYKMKCVLNISEFLERNNYEGVLTEKTLISPSTKDFQNIVKFICGFIDTSIMYKFEEDVIFILKTLKYPYSNEITKSQLSSITPHAWPALLSMISWLCDLVKSSLGDRKSEKSLDLEFFDHVCTEYTNFMTGNENDEAELEFLKKIEDNFVANNDEAEEYKNNIEILEDEVSNLRTQFEDLNVLENKKKALKDEINHLIVHTNQLESKKQKHIENIDEMNEKLIKLNDNIKQVGEYREELKEKISKQDVNIEDIKELNDKRNLYIGKLEKLKSQKELLTSDLNRIQCAIGDLEEKRDHLIQEISMLKNISTDELSLELKTHESEFLSRKDLALKYELECKSLEAKLQECKTLEEDLDKKYNHSTQKLANINEIYNEKKEVFDNNHQNSLNETDKLENDLLKLKLESDSVYIKSERDFSESQIQLDVVKSFIARERNEINKILLEFENYVNNQFNTLKEISEEVKENLK